jgi:hypothetical protein
MSFYSDASLVLIPSGYKDQKIYSAKPTDGAGDLVFSRASDATRVASNGLIEKVRTNLTLFSEQFDNAAYSKGTLTVSANAATAPNGTTTADLIYPSANSSNCVIFNGVTISSGVEYSNSVYVKASGKTWTFIRGINDGAGAFFDLSNGVVGTVQSGVTATITSIGSGWYRCSVTQTSTSTTGRLVILVVDGNGSTAVTANGTDGLLIWGGQQEAGVMTDYIATTTTAVSVGPVSGLPRLDYYDSTCPKLLLEPQRTNGLLFSEQFDNAAWTKLGATITANNATSPDGYINADFFAETATLTNGNNRILRQDVSTTANVPYTYSIFIKKNGTRYISMNLSTTTYSGGCTANVDLDNPTSVVSAAYGTGATLGAASIVSYGNNWYRINLTATFSAATTLRCQLNISQDSNFTINYNGNVLNGVLLYGAALEQGAYATSYIPTLSTSVTRVADAASKTGISSLIGQTEGTLFCDIQWVVKPESGSPIVSLVSLNNAANLNNCIILGIERLSGGTNRFYSFVQVGGATVVSLIGSTLTNGRYKAALAYKENDFVLYVNGVQIATDTSGAVPTNSVVIVGGRFVGDSVQVADPINQALLFKTRLTNDALASLTTL